ncbi:hypothetical protein [Pseudooceanicola sp.]|uniref:hypothetical protein n=1 Tax=Pseudooceanicola sp. TaxID=1914328 RepID=UPI004057F0B9
MCVFGNTPKISAAAPIVAATDNRAANQNADIEARLRRRRAGAAANVLTSAVGIPATSKLGQPS